MNRSDKSACSRCGYDRDHADATVELEKCPRCDYDYFDPAGSPCPRCGLPATDYTELGRKGDPTIVRSYAGRTQADAAELFAREAPLLASVGYRPVIQSWGEGRPGLGRTLAIGILATALRPNGYLTVTYAREGADGAGVPTRVTKICPDCAEEILEQARICRYCRHEFWPET